MRVAVDRMVKDSIEGTKTESIESIAKEAARQEAASEPNADSASSSEGFLPGSAKDLAQTAQSAITIAAIAAAGIWTIYVFVLGRTASGIVQVQLRTKQIIDRPSSTSALVSVSVRNVGRSRVDRELIQLRVMPIIDDEPLDEPLTALQSLSAITAPLDDLQTKSYDLFVEPITPDFTRRDFTFDRLEPNEDASEDVLVNFGKNDMLKVEAVFVGYSYQVFAGLREDLRRIIGSPAREGSTWYARAVLSQKDAEDDRPDSENTIDDSGKSYPTPSNLLDAPDTDSEDGGRNGN